MIETFLSYGFDPAPPARSVPGGVLLGVEVTAPPAYEPVTNEEAKLHCEYDLDDRDDLFGIYVKAAREYVESAFGLAIMAQVVRATFRGPAAEVYLPRRPAGAVSTAVEVSDGTAIAQTAASYYAEGQNPVRLRKKNSAHVIGAGLALQVTYAAGFATGGTESEQRAAVPAPLRAAVLQLVATMFEDRVPYVTGHTLARLPAGWDELLSAYRNTAI